jgi:hypothetical protein
MEKALVDLINKTEKESTPFNPANPPSIEELDYVHVTRQVYPKKGKWLRVKPVKESE